VLESLKRPGIFYGWYIAASSLVINFFGAGIAVYSFGLFATSLLEEFGWERGELYLATTISAIAGGISGPFIGRWIDRHGIKPFIPICALMAGLFLALLAFTQSIWYFYAIYTLVTLTRAGISPVPVNTMLSNWFDRRRGIALGVVETGISWGGIVLTPLTALIIVNLGWRSAYVILGVATILLTVPLVTFVMKLRPEEIGEIPDGTLSTAYRQPAFWVLITIFFLFRFAMSGVLYHVIPFMVGAGVSATVAAGMVSGIAGAGIAGKLIGGYMADRVGARAIGAFACLLHAGAIVILPLFDTMPMYWLFAILFGFSFGAMSPIMAMLVAQCFGRQSFGTIYGTVAISITAGIGVGPIFSAYIFDATGTYDPAFFSLIPMLVIAGGMILLARAPKFSEHQSPHRMMRSLGDKQSSSR
jgi:MFS family permease